MKNPCDTRIYGNAVNIDSDAIRLFWNTKAQQDSSLKAVLLGSDFASNSGILRNERENKILQSFVGTNPLSILDIGCGIGRWAHNLQYQIKVYHGIDFSDEFVKAAGNTFKENPNVQFFQMSATEIDTARLLPCYDLIIVTGVAMYINDDTISRLFYFINQLTNAASSVYFQESVSILPKRLTLKDFESVELKSKYNAIYRTGEEYEMYFERYLPDFHFEKEATRLLLDKDTGAREETNARYWYLIRKK
ncbi:MAG: class I SAM-dependent methyltransferase [Bacteroidales bacterium]|nr:class I SAM-dependent methyltransferase [Bacteroidales bacterium]